MLLSIGNLRKIVVCPFSILGDTKDMAVTLHAYPPSNNKGKASSNYYASKYH